MGWDGTQGSPPLGMPGERESHGPDLPQQGCQRNAGWSCKEEDWSLRLLQRWIRLPQLLTLDSL